MNCLIVILLFITCNYYGIDASLLQETHKDETLEDRATGYDVVVAVVKKIKDSGIFQDDNGILKRIAYVESKFGEDPNTFLKDYHGGIWQIKAGDQGSFNEITKKSASHQTLYNVILPAIKDKFGIDINKVEYKDLEKPLYSGLFARMRLALVSEAIPDQSDIEGQGKYWMKYYNNGEGKGSEEKFVKDVEEMEKQFEKNCHGLMDLAIVMDGSGSIGNNGYKLAKEFVVKLIQTFSLDSVNVGFVVFSTTSQVIFPMDSNLTSSQLEEIIMNSPYPDDWTNTNLGIKSGVDMLQNATKRPGVPKIMTVFTDGEPTCSAEDLDQALNKARANNITMFSIGIGSNILQDNLVKMAGSSNRVFSMSSYKSLSKSFQLINGETCKIPQKPELNSTLIDFLGEFENRYFQYELPPNGLTIKVNNHGGNTIGFYSYDNENPSSALNDGSFKRQTFIPFRQIERSRFKREVKNNTVFIAIEGLEPTNNYTFVSEQGNHE